MDTHKTCRECGDSLPLDSFPRYRRSKDGRYGDCKVCHVAKVRAWQMLNRDKVRDYQRGRYQRDRVKLLAQAKVRSQTPEGKRQSYEGVKRWRQRHHDVYRWAENTYKRLTRSEQYVHGWPLVVEHYGGRCLGCGGEATCSDHVIPLNQGGDNALWNLQPLCRACNVRKRGSRVDMRPDRGAWISALCANRGWVKIGEGRVPRPSSIPHEAEPVQPLHRHDPANPDNVA